MAKILSNNKRTLDELIPKDDEEQKIFRRLKIQKLKEIEQDLEFKTMPLELETMPTLFFCSNGYLGDSLQCIANITGTSAFNSLITSFKESLIMSPIHLINDPSMEPETISMTVHYFWTPHGYFITTQNIKIGDLPFNIKSLISRFLDRCIDKKERLIQVRGNFNGWTCPFNRIVINQNSGYKRYKITEVLRHFKAKTDKIIFVKGLGTLASDLDYVIENISSSLDELYHGLLILVDDENVPFSWNEFKRRWNRFEKRLDLDSVVYPNIGRKDLYKKNLVLNNFIHSDFKTKEVTNHINKFLLQ